MSSICETASSMENIVREAMIGLSDNHDDMEKWIVQVGKNIRLLNAALKKGELNVGGKKHLESCIGKMKGYRVMMKAMKHQGGGVIRNRRSQRIRWEDVNSAFKGRLRTGVIVNLTHKMPAEFLEDAKFLFASRIRNGLKIHPQIKVNVDFGCEFTKAGEDSYEFKHFNTRNGAIDSTTDLNEWWMEHVQDPLLVQLQEFQERDSGWSLSTVVNLAVNINKYEPMRGSSYIEIPPQIQRKHACINVKNEDDACFGWAVVSALYPASQNSDRITSYPHYTEVLNLNGIEFPMTMKQVSKFEKLNNVSINVYSLEKKKKQYHVLPTLLTKTKKDRHVNLLIVQDRYDNEDRPITYHYCWIKNLGRLVRQQVGSHMLWICDRCLHHFYNEDKLQRHAVDCTNMNDCKIRMPVKGEKVKFKAVNNQERAPFIIYMDIESLLKPVTVRRGEKTRYQEHEAYSVGYYFCCSYDDSLSYYKTYRGNDCGKWFAKELGQIVEDVEPVYWAMQPMHLTSQEEEAFLRATTCHICNNSFTDGDKKVRDHAHITGKFRGAAHTSCNLNYQDTRHISVVAHNLSGYDSHFLIKDIAQEIEGNIFLLPVNKEKYISFTKTMKDSKIKFRFIDSCRFMSSSLGKLASYLDELQIIRREFPGQYGLLRRKGIFPYDYIKSAAYLEETKLPPRAAFYNKLTETHICDADYEHATTVWREFNIHTLGEYSDLYLKTDVLLLADVFENFRDLCMETYGLDAAHYVSAPALTWAAMLKYTGVELQLLDDIYMLMFVERGIRGGVSQCSNRYAKANNKYIPEYDPTQESVYLQYYDVNNLYGWAMSEHLPYDNFKWVDPLDITVVPDDSPVGYIAEVDLEYPEAIHDVHKDLPFCPEHLTAPGSKQKKLLTTLYNKQRYIIHYRSLKQALQHGLKLKKIHRILEFSQAAWMKPYIELNTFMRTKAQNEFEKFFFKLMNNAAFGKTMEDVRKHKVVKLVSKWDGRYSAKVLIARPNFHSRLILDEDLVLIELNKCEVYMNKPLYIGMAILDISKTKLYAFHYNYMQPNFQRCKILYTDTDSLIYEIHTPDVYESIKRDIQYFDTSDYPPNNVYGMPLVNKKVPGLMKDENGGIVMKEFVGLKSKMYATRVQGRVTVKKAKGVKNYIVKNSLSFNDYLQCLIDSNIVLREQNSIMSFGHKVYTIAQNKVALSALDDKIRLLPNTTDTLPWGHYSLIT